jgi:Sigma-70, region 4
VPVVLCYLEGKTYDEVAGQLGCLKGTISIRLTRARELLRKRLGERGVALPAAALAAVLCAQAAAAAFWFRGVSEAKGDKTTRCLPQAALGST